MIFTNVIFSLLSPLQFFSKNLGHYNNGAKSFPQFSTSLRSSTKLIGPIGRYNRQQKVEILRSIINNSSSIAVMPCCYDGLSAKLVEASGINIFH